MSIDEARLEDLEFIAKGHLPGSVGMSAIENLELIRLARLGLRMQEYFDRIHNDPSNPPPVQKVLDAFMLGEWAKAYGIPALRLYLPFNVAKLALSKLPSEGGKSG